MVYALYCIIAPSTVLRLSMHSALPAFSEETENRSAIPSSFQDPPSLTRSKLMVSPSKEALTVAVSPSIFSETTSTLKSSPGGSSTTIFSKSP